MHSELINDEQDEDYQFYCKKIPVLLQKFYLDKA